MKLTDFSVLFCGVLLNALAQLGLKAATRVSGPLIAGDTGVWQKGLQLLTVPPLWYALVAYGLSVIVWLVGLSRVPVSQAYPLLSLGYVINIGLAWWLLGRGAELAARRRHWCHRGWRHPGSPFMNDVPKPVKPLLPFTRPSIDEETIAAVAEVLRSGWLATGPKVAQFEAELSRYLRRVGRSARRPRRPPALEIALLACGIGRGDEVITRR